MGSGYRVLGLAMLFVVLDASPGMRSAGAAGSLVAFTQNQRVGLMSLDGTGRRMIAPATPQHAPNSIYSWSPDGRYLLVVRPLRSGNRYTMTLRSSSGAYLRSLGTGVYLSWKPTWAVDADQVVYVVRRSQQPQPRGQVPPGLPSNVNFVNATDVNGRSVGGWHYTSQDFCEGGPADVATGLMLDQTFDYTNRMIWSTARHTAIYSSSCNGGVSITNTTTGRTVAGRLPGKSAYITQLTGTRDGKVAALLTTSGHTDQMLQVVLLDPATGAVRKIVSPGELPAWSADGRWLYFVRRTKAAMVDDRSSPQNPTRFQTYRSAIWRAGADGSRPVQLASEDAFAFGAPNPTSDGRSVVYSRVDNPTELLRRHLPVFMPSPSMVARYGPFVSIRRLDIGRGSVTLAAHAGLPVTQP